MNYPIDIIREAFPSLLSKDDGKRRIYLDNPAGTQVPQSVADAIFKTVLYGNANLGGAFPTSIIADSVIEQGHQAMADLFGCTSEEVIIGPNMTSLTYHFSRMIGYGLKAGDEIIVTQMDHEGNVSPWLQLADELDLAVRKLPFDEVDWQIKPEALSKLLNEKTRVLALNYSSNLTGSINNVKALVALAKAAGVTTFVDAVQFAPHGFMDVKDIDCDFMICSSYKFFGPHLGILYGRKSVLEKLTPLKCRCSGNELPYRFETGTPQIELVAGLTAAVDHFANIGSALGANGSRRDLIKTAFEASNAYENQLAIQLIEGLSQISGLRIQGITEPEKVSQRVPTISFTLEDIMPKTLVERLNHEGIFCWSGHNYAWEVVHQLGINPDHGVVRIGIANYNTQQEIVETVESVTRNVAMLRQER